MLLRPKNTFTKLTHEKFFYQNIVLFIFIFISMIISFEIIIHKHNKIDYLYLFIVTIAPTILLFIKTQGILCEEIFTIIQNFKNRFSRYRLNYLIFIIIYSIFFIILASIRISTLTERDRWILDNSTINIFDPPFPPRLGLVLSWFLPTDIAIALIGLFCLIIWFSFLIYINNSDSSLPVIFTFALTSFSGVLYNSMYAEMELPAALLGFIGLYGIWKKQFNTGFLFLTIGGIFKNTGLFQLITGLILFVFICWKDRSLQQYLKKIDWQSTAFFLVFIILNHINVFYYILFIRGGPDYLVDTLPGQLFWLSTFEKLTNILYTKYTILVIFSVFGVLLNKKQRWFFILTTGVLIFLRSFSRWVDNEYVMILIPGLSYFSLFGIKSIFKLLKQSWMQYVLNVALSVICIYSAVNVVNNFKAFLNKTNSNFNEFITNLAENLPQNAEIFQREISLKPYLINKEREDIKYTYYDEGQRKEEILNNLKNPGCKLIIMQKDDLGITKDDLTFNGFSDKPFYLYDSMGNWISLSKDCQ